jgi:hypothetical protein
VKTTTLPSAEQLKQLDEGVQAGARDAIAIGRIAAERGAGTLAAKAASARRELARATAAGAGKERLERLRAQASAYAERARQGAEQAKMARSLEKIGAAFGQRPAAYGRAVDERGRGHADLPVALVTEGGETLVAGRTDEDGYFALSLSASTEVTGDVVLRIGDKGALGAFPVTSQGRLLPPREIVVTGRRGGGDTTVPPKRG